MLAAASPFTLWYCWLSFDPLLVWFVEGGPSCTRHAAITVLQWQPMAETKSKHLLWMMSLVLQRRWHSFYYLLSIWASWNISYIAINHNELKSGIVVFSWTRFGAFIDFMGFGTLSGYLVKLGTFHRREMFHTHKETWSLGICFKPNWCSHRLTEISYNFNPYVKHSFIPMCTVRFRDIICSSAGLMPLQTETDFMWVSHAEFVIYFMFCNSSVFLSLLFVGILALWLWKTWAVHFICRGLDKGRICSWAVK